LNTFVFETIYMGYLTISYFAPKGTQDKCFHYSNLQPLWFIDNLIKNDKMPNGEMARSIWKISETFL